MAAILMFFVYVQISPTNLVLDIIFFESLTQEQGYLNVYKRILNYAPFMNKVCTMQRQVVEQPSYVISPESPAHIF